MLEAYLQLLWLPHMSCHRFKMDILSFILLRILFIFVVLGRHFCYGDTFNACRRMRLLHKVDTNFSECALKTLGHSAPIVFCIEYCDNMPDCTAVSMQMGDITSWCCAFRRDNLNVCEGNHTLIYSTNKVHLLRQDAVICRRQSQNALTVTTEMMKESRMTTPASSFKSSTAGMETHAEESYTKYEGKLCPGQLTSTQGNSNSDHQNCKDWCSAKTNCGGFSYDGRCWFKDTECDSLKENYPGVDLYIKN